MTFSQTYCIEQILIFFLFNFECVYVNEILVLFKLHFHIILKHISKKSAVGLVINYVDLKVLKVNLSENPKAD